MELEGFAVRGIRSLGSVEEVPVGRPTILTGANDAGKTASIFALSFLLGGPAPKDDDRTWALEGDEPLGGIADDGRCAETCVVGRFSLDSSEQSEFGLPQQVLIRRRSKWDEGAVHEIQLDVPIDERLRNLSEARLDDLRDRASALGVDAEGPATAKRSFITPLQRLADSAATTTAWTGAPSALLDRLPRMLSFSSTREPDPEAEITTILRAEYVKLLENPELTGVLRKVESDVRQRLQEEADDLREHIRLRVPELTGISIVPSVSFSGGFRGTALLTDAGGGGPVPLLAVGSGRRRRMTLAIWEWTSGILGCDESARPTVIAYDEPDTHLDYARQRDLVDLIRAQAATPHVRVIVATHSLNLIDKVDISDVVHLALADGRTIVRRLPGTGHRDIDRYLAEVAAAMGMRNSVLLHERCFLGVEGATETQALPTLFRLVTGYSLQAAGIALLPGNSNVGAFEVARYLNNQGRRVMFIVDADSSRASGARKLFRPESLRSKGIGEHQIRMIGNPGDIEDLFSDAQWSYTANRHWSRVDGQSWTEAHFAALRTGDGFAKRLATLVEAESGEAPSDKPGYLVTLASDLSARDEVPAQLDAALTAVFESCN